MKPTKTYEVTKAGFLLGSHQNVGDTVHLTDRQAKYVRDSVKAKPAARKTSAKKADG